MESIDFEKEEMVVRSGSWPSLDDKQLHAHRLFARSLTQSLMAYAGLSRERVRQVRRGVPSRSLTGLWRPGTTRQDGLAAEATWAWVPRLHTHACAAWMRLCRPKSPGSRGPDPSPTRSPVAVAAINRKVCACLLVLKTRPLINVSYSLAVPACLPT